MCLLSYLGANAQAFISPITHPKNELARTQIDAKRVETDGFSKDALVRAREFKRTDSSYYVGWMYEGMYLAENAADYLGYNNAIASLRKTLDLIENDYPKYLKLRSGDFFEYYPVYGLHSDYTNVADALVDCYNNTNQPDSSYAIIRRVQRNNLQNEGRLATYNALAWLVHRNRFYTSEKHGFLLNSIAENEALANAFLDSSMLKIRKDSKLNSEFYGSSYEEYMRYAVYHYKAMLHGYNLHIDSTEYYYAKMKGTPYFSHNNYANFCMVKGNFKQAEEHYQIAADNNTAPKQLKEYEYYQGIVDVYKNNLDASAQRLKELIQHTGSTPGFGWYNIALARNMNYGGNIAAAQKYADKAGAFKEIHIGTTLGASHYDFSLKLVKLHLLQNQLQYYKFQHKNWWYNIPVLLKMASTYIKMLNLKYDIVNQLSVNPEREAVIYKQFATESTVAWDEITLLLDGFSTNYFKKKYEEYAATDPRNKVKSYFRYELAQLNMKQGNTKIAHELLDELLQEGLDDAYEKLLLGRIYLAKLKLALEDNDDKLSQIFYLKLYETYPQLIPFANIKPTVVLQMDKEKHKDIWKMLKKYKINWVEEGSEHLPNLQIFSSSTGAVAINVNVYNGFDNSAEALALSEDKTLAVEEIMQVLFGLLPNEE